MLKINNKKFNFQFFLSDRIKVNNLEEGALQYGGATKTESETYSNIEGSENIILNSTNNKLSIFIPNTLNVDTKTDNTKFIEYATNYIQSNFNSNNIIYYSTQGSWYSEDLNKVVYDDITIISFEAQAITEEEINKMVTLAKYIKYEMSQEGVSININTALAIV